MRPRWGSGSIEKRNSFVLVIVENKRKFKKKIGTSLGNNGATAFNDDNQATAQVDLDSFHKTNSLTFSSVVNLPM